MQQYDPYVHNCVLLTYVRRALAECDLPVDELRDIEDLKMLNRTYARVSFDACALFFHVHNGLTWKTRMCQ